MVLDPTESNLAGKATSKGNRITASLIKTSKYSGIYKVSYRAISVDGTTIQSFLPLDLANVKTGQYIVVHRLRTNRE